MLSKELLVLDHIYLHPNASQRDLSVTTGISLGQINLIIKKLCASGLLRQDIISKRSIKYILTQQGIAERARLFNENILSTIRKYKKIRDSVRHLLSNLYANGCREFVLEGVRGEIHEVISEVFDDHFGERASLVWGPAEIKEGRIVLNLDRRFLADKHTVNVLHEIAV